MHQASKNPRQNKDLTEVFLTNQNAKGSMTQGLLASSFSLKVSAWCQCSVREA